MAHERINSDALPRTRGVYSAAVVAGDHCYVSGMLPLRAEDATVVPGGIAEQTRQALKNVFVALEAAGFTPGELVSVTTMLADIDDWSAFNDTYAEIIDPAHLPTRMAVQAGRLPAGVLVEIQAIAVRER